MHYPGHMKFSMYKTVPPRTLLILAVFWMMLASVIANLKYQKTHLSDISCGNLEIVCIWTPNSLTSDIRRDFKAAHLI